MKRSFDKAFNDKNDNNDDDDDNIIKIRLPKRYKEAWEDFSYSQYTKSLEESTLNYNKETDTIYCPILLDDVPVDQSTTLTCCWNAIHNDCIDMIKKESCIWCRKQVTFKYIIVMQRSYYRDTKYTFKLGFHPKWTLTKILKEIHERLSRYLGDCSISKLWIFHPCHSNERIYYIRDEKVNDKQCYEYNIRNTTRIVYEL